MRSVHASLTLRLAILLAITAASLGVPVLQHASASDGRAVLLESADVVELPPLSLTVKASTARRELLQGERVNGTCRFSMSFHAEAGDTTPQLATVVAIDPESCTAEIERGELSELPSELSVNREGASVEASDTDVGAEGQNQNRKATFWTIWEDPAKARVAVVRTSVRSFVKNRFIDRAECRLLLDPLEQTGWQEDRSYRDFRLQLAR